MIADAVDVAFAVIAAAVMWVAVVGGVAAGLVVAVCAWLGPRVARCGAWRRLTAPRRAPRASRVATDPPRPAHGHTAPRPLWAHSQPLAYEETA